MESKFVLFSNCVPVKGFNRSIICDLQNNDFYFIPNGLYDILLRYNGCSLEYIKTIFKNKYDEIIEEYFDFLVSNRLIFFTSNPELFPKINFEWQSPSLVTNMIIDYEDIIHDFENIAKQFETIKCSNIQLRFFKYCSLDFIKRIAERIDALKSRITSIDFILPFSDDFQLEDLNLLLKKNPRIHSIILYNSPFTKNHEPIYRQMGYLMFVERNIVDQRHCGKISEEYFFSNVNLFAESQKHNTCLNRKISIDKYGNIKNCPSMNDSFGNIKDKTLLEALNEPQFKMFWNINKDEILVCKDCEFRHICTDCRAYVEDPEDKYSKPLKCGYNPYTNEWSEWSDNTIKLNAIKEYGLSDLFL